MKKPVCPFNYMEANLGLSRGDADMPLLPERKNRYPKNRKPRATDCYVCGKELSKFDRKYSTGTVANDGYCKKCRTEQSLIRRIKKLGKDQVETRIKEMQRLLRVYKNVLKEMEYKRQ